MLEFNLIALLNVYLVDKFLWHNNKFLIWLRKKLTPLDKKLNGGVFCYHCNILRFSFILVYITNLRLLEGIYWPLDMVICALILACVTELWFGIYNSAVMLTYKRIEYENTLETKE